MKKTVSFSKRASNVFFHILTQCNLSCRHCYINRGQHGTRAVSRDEMESWLSLFAEKSPESNVIFLGGEPTMHPDLPFGIKKARELGYTSITVDTNGYLFHDFLSQVSPLDVDFISFSLDGATKGVNDSIRGTGSYEVCLAGIRKAVSMGFSTSLIYTVSGENLTELDQMPPLLVDLGIKEFFIQVIGIRGNSAEKGGAHLQVTRDLWQKVVPRVAEHVAGLGIPVTFPKVFLDETDCFECAGLVANNYFIFPNGRVYRCPLCEDYPLHAHEIKDNKLFDRPKIHEMDLFQLAIPEGCVMNKLIQPDNLSYGPGGIPRYRIACCLLKERVEPGCAPL
ncbi:MAG: radical SAM protein [Proteobacteria bacterium]|nr:radical SAM protein [Pseudomonadota bacterium]